jgi:hypothetical protein
MQEILNKLEIFIAGLFFEYYHLKWKKNFHPQSFNNIFESVRDVLIIMPVDEKGVSAGIALVKHLIEKNKHVTILIHNKFRSLLPLSLHAKVEEFYESEIFSFGIPRPLFLYKLHQLQVDIVIDLDGKTEFLTAVMALAIQAKNKVGVRKKHSDKVYNLEFGLSGISMVESYQNYVNLLCTL